MKAPPLDKVLSTKILTQGFGAFSIFILFSYKNFTLRSGLLRNPWR